MPDPAVTEALAEAYALAPSDEVILNTIEVRHPSFVDEDGNPDSVWLVADQQDFAGTIEADAPVRGGETVTFLAFAFSFHLPPIEPGATPEIEIAIDNVTRDLIAQFDRAIEDPSPITMVYRPYLASDTTGPQMDPPPSFELSDIHVGVLRVTMRARTSVDLRGAFPRRLYDAASFPGLIGR